MTKKTSIFENGLIWFGAGISIAEILTGTYFAPIGLSKGILAIILGHLIGGILMFLAGVIGAKTNKTAMETVKMSFGFRGGMLFAFINVIQLAGWTAIMIYDGALAASKVFQTGLWIFACVIGILIILWIIIGVTDLGKINMVTMTALCLLTLVLSGMIFTKNGTQAVISKESITFGACLELSVAMPLSWLPVISDYTRLAEKPIKATFISVLVYNIVSIWMYVIGLGAALFAGTGDIAEVLLRAGVGVFGLMIIIGSTVTTTFLDAYSAGVSALSLSKKIPLKTAAILVTVLGTILAILFNMDDITGFLFFLGSVFAPMIAILIIDYFILKKDGSGAAFNGLNVFVWIIGFGLYRYLLTVDMVVGNTFPSIVLTMALKLLAEAFSKTFHKQEQK